MRLSLRRDSCSCIASDSIIDLLLRRIPLHTTLDLFDSIPRDHGFSRSDVVVHDVIGAPVVQLALQFMFPVFLPEMRNVRVCSRLVQGPVIGVPVCGAVVDVFLHELFSGVFCAGEVDEEVAWFEIGEAPVSFGRD